MSEPGLPDQPAASLRVRFFDGLSSQPTLCLLTLVPTEEKNEVGLRLDPASGDTSDHTVTPLRAFTAAQIEWPDAGATRIAVIRFDDGSQAQMDGRDAVALADALHGAGYRPPGLHALAQRMAGSWRELALGTTACAVLSVLVWLYGVPLAASAITRALPVSWDTQLGTQALQTLDQSWLKPSALPQERRQQITRDFAALVQKAWPDGSAPAYRLEFRAARERLTSPGPASGAHALANALALPGGTLVLTDELVAVAGPDALLGVLAHELGHVQRRHATRVAVEGALLGTGVAVIMGDVTSVLATAPVLLATLSFSRAHELEADCYALATLQRAGVSARPLASLLESIAGVRTSTAADGATERVSSRSDVLSSHPSTPARAELLRDAALARRSCG